MVKEETWELSLFTSHGYNLIAHRVERKVVRLKAASETSTATTSSTWLESNLDAAVIIVMESY